jgi:hypothetical protein
MTKRLTDEELSHLRSLCVEREIALGFQADNWPTVAGAIAWQCPALLDEIEERRLADTKKSTGENED